MSASIEPKVRPPRGVESALKSALGAMLSPFLLPLADERVCAHDKLVFDEINDVYCKHCGKDFTG